MLNARAMLGNVWIEALQLLGSSLRQELIGSISFLASSFQGLGSDPQLGSMWSVKYFTSAIVNISGDVWNRTVEFLVSDPRPFGYWSVGLSPRC